MFCFAGKITGWKISCPNSKRQVKDGERQVKQLGSELETPCRKQNNVLSKQLWVWDTPQRSLVHTFLQIYRSAHGHCDCFNPTRKKRNGLSEAHISCGMPLSPLIAGVHVEAQGYFSIRAVVCFLWLDCHIWRRRYPTNLVCPVSYSPTCDRPFSSQSSFFFGGGVSLNRVSLCSPCWSPNWIAQAVLELTVNLLPRPPEYWDCRYQPRAWLILSFWQRGD